MSSQFCKHHNMLLLRQWLRKINLWMSIIANGTYLNFRIFITFVCDTKRRNYGTNCLEIEKVFEPVNCDSTLHTKKLRIFLPKTKNILWWFVSRLFDYFNTSIHVYLHYKVACLVSKQIVITQFYKKFRANNFLVNVYILFLHK